ncbi:MAG TPA: tubulin-like doman-containing protein, partial [Gemmata sp.]|nr:tubulin-like doman-containing protein [Gemmata sp.]
QRFRFDLTERYGPPESMPLIRTLYVDTDPEALEDSVRPRPPARRAGMRHNDVFPAKLNRTGHYLKPRFNGKALIEGWFDPQLLYKLPRTPVTMGVRLFGRLAFCDHYRALMAKVQNELEAALAPDAIAQTEAVTGLQHRTNRPRVYIVASLSGGTGGGMFLDMAYSVRARLRRTGYENPEIIGILIVPPCKPSVTPPLWLGNTYASLMELNHYSRPDTTFTATYEEQTAVIRDKSPPFSQCYILAGRAPSGQSGTALGSGAGYSAAQPGSGTRPRVAGSAVVARPATRSEASLSLDTAAPPASVQSAFRPYGDAAELLRLQLFTPIGATASNRRKEAGERAGSRGITVATFGLSGFGWPRAEIIDRTTARVARTVLKRWAAPDLQRSREVMPGIAQNRWTKMGLDPDAITASLHEVAHDSAGGKIDQIIDAQCEALKPRGWLARLPEPVAVATAVAQFEFLLGTPAAPGSRYLVPVEEAINAAVAARSTRLAREIHNLVPTLVNDPQFRLAGVEELIRQFLATTDRLLERFGQAIGELDAKAQTAYELLTVYSKYTKGMRKPGAAEFADALKSYPHSRIQSAIYRGLLNLYQTVRESLLIQLNDVATARQRLDAAAKEAAPSPNTSEPPAHGRRLMPTGCTTLEAAVAKFAGAINDAEFMEIDGRVQAALDPQLHGIFLACLRSASGPERVVSTIHQETRAYLETRLGEVDLAAMFRDRFQSREDAERALEDAFHDAEPALVGTGSWCAEEVAVVGCPDGAGGEPMRELARRAIPVAGLPISPITDEFLIYREWPGVPVAALPHLGSDGLEAFQALTGTQQCPAHSRLDVVAWHAFEEG